MTSEFLHPDPGPDTFTVPVVVEHADPIEDDLERALPDSAELHVIEDAGVWFQRDAAHVLGAFDEVDNLDDPAGYGTREDRITDHLMEVMPPVMTKHVLAYLQDIGLVQRRAKRGLGTFWQRINHSAPEHGQASE